MDDVLVSGSAELRLVVLNRIDDDADLPFDTVAKRCDLGDEIADGVRYLDVWFGSLNPDCFAEYDWE